jgi:hypothetical protein
VVSNIDDLLGLEPEIEPWRVLELHTPPHTVALTLHNDERRKESFHVEVPLKLGGAPHLTVLGFEGFTAARLGVDFGEFLSADVFGWIGHVEAPLGWKCLPEKVQGNRLEKTSPGRDDRPDEAYRETAQDSVLWTASYGAAPL